MSTPEQTCPGDIGVAQQQTTRTMPTTSVSTPPGGVLPPKKDPGHSQLGTSFTWLHISDLHIGVGSDKTIDNFAHLSEARDLSPSAIDCIIITGDVIDKGQYKVLDRGKQIRQKAIEEIEALRRRINKRDEKPPFILMVPGNHDVTREPPSTEDFMSLPCCTGDYLDKGEKEGRRFKKWVKMVTQIYGTHDVGELSSSTRMEIEVLRNPLFFRLRLKSGYAPAAPPTPSTPPPSMPTSASALPEPTVPPAAVTPARLVGATFYGLNSAFLANTDADEGRLFIKASQLPTSRPGHWEDGTHTFLFTHHPLSWLKMTPELVKFLKKVRVHSFGHLHQGDTFIGVHKEKLLFLGAGMLRKKWHFSLCTYTFELPQPKLEIHTFQPIVENGQITDRPEIVSLTCNFDVSSVTIPRASTGENMIRRLRIMPFTQKEDVVDRQLLACNYVMATSRVLYRTPLRFGGDLDLIDANYLCNCSKQELLRKKLEESLRLVRENGCENTVGYFHFAGTRTCSELIPPTNGDIWNEFGCQYYVPCNSTGLFGRQDHPFDHIPELYILYDPDLRVEGILNSKELSYRPPSIDSLGSIVFSSESRRYPGIAVYPRRLKPVFDSLSVSKIFFNSTEVTPMSFGC
ncbi:hypothetical protein Pelo_10961 [Pelomyxa schiedti]|nr:hypothetical protein Pelo_10961 [Pelomyxa schiedti]